tara:strand:+ start:19563 stop:20303 length:741 start_codon:yes stop_codon:yes gene_type:complete
MDVSAGATSTAMFGGVQYVMAECDYYITAREIAWKAFLGADADTADASAATTDISINFAVTSDASAVSWFMSRYKNIIGKSTLDIVNTIVPPVDLRIDETIDMIETVEIYCSALPDDKCATACSMQTMDISDVGEGIDGLYQITTRIADYINCLKINEGGKSEGGIGGKSEGGEGGKVGKITPPKPPAVVIPDKIMAAPTSFTEVKNNVELDLELAGYAQLISQYHTEVINMMWSVVLICKDIVSV